MAAMSAWEPLIYGGCFAATLSSAIASLVGAPRVFMASTAHLFGLRIMYWRLERVDFLHPPNFIFLLQF
jgi:hypothetical protein